MGKDAWEENRSGLARFFDEHPDIAAALDSADNDSLNGADLSAKSALYQDRGLLKEAAGLFQQAWRKCYPAEYISAFEGQLDFIAGELSDCPGPVVDIASGRGMLVERLLGKTRAPITATDLSPSVLRDHLGSRWPALVDSGRLTLTACDAKDLPFADGSVPAMTTCMGLQNIPSPESAVRELRRVCAGTLYALCLFFPDDDIENQEAAARFGLEGAYSRKELVALMERCGWEVSCHESPACRQPPTPVGVVVPGMGFDGLPVVETEAQFITLICR